MEFMSKARRVATKIAQISTFLSLLLVPFFAHAQADAAISGTVTDPTGSAVAAAVVKVSNTETGFTRNVTADDGGRFEVPLLPVGNYVVRVEKAGFRPAQASITLVVGQRASLDLKLSVAEVEQAVVVQELALSENVTNADVSGLVSEAQVRVMAEPDLRPAAGTILYLRPRAERITWFDAADGTACGGAA